MDGVKLYNNSRRIDNAVKITTVYTKTIKYCLLFQD